MSEQGRTPKKAEVWRPAFLAALANSANVRAACQAAGIGRTTAYEAREHAPQFKKAWDDAIDEACDLLEATAFRRAMGGESDTLLIFLLKSHRPAVYRERRDLDVTSGGNPLDLASLILAAADEPHAPPVGSNGHHRPA